MTPFVRLLIRDFEAALSAHGVARVVWREVVTRLMLGPAFVAGFLLFLMLL